MELVAQIDEISQLEDRSKTAVIRRAIAMYRAQSSELHGEELAAT
jgi:predicted transcriptional regulator